MNSSSDSDAAAMAPANIAAHETPLREVSTVATVLTTGASARGADSE